MVRVLFSTPPVFVSVFVYNILSASVIVENILSLLSRGRSSALSALRACSMAQDGMQAAWHDGKVWLRVHNGQIEFRVRLSGGPTHYMGIVSCVIFVRLLKLRTTCKGLCLNK